MHKTCRTILFLLIGSAFCSAAQASIRFNISIDKSARSVPTTGRVILIVSRMEKPEPRLLVAPNSVPIFGVDAENLNPGQAVTIDQTTLGHPIDSLNQIAAGDYYVQAIMDVYTECHRADGHTVWVHWDAGGGETPTTFAGNLYSDVKKVHFDLSQNLESELTLNHVIPAEKPAEDTKWLKHVRIQSKLLSQFWGVPVYLGATVLLPKGYDEHPDMHYPAVYAQGFLGAPPFYFTDDPKTLKQEEGIRRTGLQPGYEFYQSWTSDHFPRFLAVTFFEPCPFFVDAYSVNSVNSGPYGDAITQELIPYVESHFRGIGKGYARTLEGASTGGWGSLDLQLKHPDFFGGAWVFYPDPIDFTRYQMVDIYKDDNAFDAPGRSWIPAERPFRRSDDGQVNITNRQLSSFEDVLGSHGRSGFQLECWEDIYGPIGSDGYPIALWDKRTGKINRDAANYMRDHGYDLTYYTKQNWPTLGPKLAGKLHFFCGDMDNFYLNLAVYKFEDMLKETSNPKGDATFIYGRPMKGHWWHPQNFAQIIQDMAVQIRKNAPDGDSTAWFEN